MASLNNCQFIGNLGRDPEVRTLPGGEQVANFSIACSESWKDKNTGEKKESTEWIPVVIYGRLAEIAGQYLKKGSSVYIAGKFKTRKWQDKQTGADRYTTEIIVNEMKMLGGKPADGGQQAPGAAAPQQRSAPAQQQKPAATDYDDDIPF